MKAMVLAAGVGSRLDPLTRTTPKPMVPIVNKPVVEHIIDLLRRHGFDDLIINLHYLGDQIKRYLGDGQRFGVRITYSEEDQLWGDAGSIKRCEAFFDETFLVVGGDDLADIDLTRFLQTHREKRALATIALSRVDDPSEYGIVLLNEEGRITRFLEKPKGEGVFSNTANTGIYLFEPEALELIPPGTRYGLGHDLFPLLLEKDRPIYGHLTCDYWRDVGNLEQYRQAHLDALDGRVGIQFPLRETRRSVWTGEDVAIDPTAEVGSPVAIGNRCRIGPGAKVREYSVLGDACVLEAGASVRESILWSGAVVGQQTRLERCVVGNDCRVTSNAGVFNAVIADPNRPD